MKKTAVLGMYLAFAMILSYIEVLIPLPIPIPGIKLGLANLAIILISHDLALVQCLCDRVLVMYQGKIVEQGKTEEVLHFPKHEYTRMLLDSVL